MPLPPANPATVQLSGILVVAAPGQLTRCVRQVEALPGVEVYFCYPESSRLIAVQETVTAAEQEEGLRCIQALPGVALAALVHHRIEPLEEAADVSPPPPQ
jgi:nitrate reductase NapAB chaperone NapD